MIVRETYDSDSAYALAIIKQATHDVSALYDCERNRPLGWVEVVLSGVVEELEWKVQHRIGC